MNFIGIIFYFFIVSRRDLGEFPISRAIVTLKKKKKIDKIHFKSSNGS